MVNNFSWNFIEVRGIWITSGLYHFNKYWDKIKFYLILYLEIASRQFSAYKFILGIFHFSIYQSVVTNFLTF